MAWNRKDIARVLVALFFFGAGVGELALTNEVVVSLEKLGYPLYLVWILGPAKILGSAALVLPVPARLREWAWAGIVFNLIGAISSQLLSGHILMPDVLLAPLALFTAVVALAPSLKPAGSSIPAVAR